jgi:PPOX class probable F420-dependent enzyme
VKLTANLPTADRARAEDRLRHNLMAWLTTVRPDGQPVTVPVWFLLCEDETIVLYSKPGAAKLRYIARNPKVSLALDVCDLGRNIVRLEGLAAPADDQPAADRNPAYLAKYTERIGALFDTPEQFAAQYSAAVRVTPTKVHV